MRAARTTLLAIAALALAAAGCGGSEVPADEVPGPPPALTVPSDSELGAGGGTDDAETDGTTDPDAAADDAAAADESATTTEPTAEPEPDAVAPETSTADPEQPPEDAPTDQFEDFCEQNAGAC